MTDGLDRLDLAILRTVQDADRALWKKAIYQSIVDAERLPEEVRDMSVQTLGRRVDALTDADLLQPTMVEPDGLSRDLIIAYTLTDEGREQMQENVEALLREHVAALRARGDSLDMPPRYLADLFSQVLELDQEGKQLLSSCSPVQLSVLIAVYYLHQDLEAAFTVEDLETLSDIGDKADPLDLVVDHVARLGQH